MQPPITKSSPAHRARTEDGNRTKADFLCRPAAAQLWRTSRPVSSFSYVGQGRKDAKLGKLTDNQSSGPTADQRFSPRPPRHFTANGYSPYRPFAGSVLRNPSVSLADVAKGGGGATCPSSL